MKVKKPIDKNKMRVAVAKDVLSRIYAGLFTPEPQIFIQANNENTVIEKAVELDEKNKDFRKVLKYEHCTVCALGGLFVSCFIKNNSINISNFSQALGNEGHIVIKYLKKYFSLKQLQMIEAAFETSGNGWFDFGSNPKRVISDGVRNQCRNFGIEQEDKTNRMIAIMNNIVRNKGIFDPLK